MDRFIYIFTFPIVFTLCCFAWIGVGPAVEGFVEFPTTGVEYRILPDKAEVSLDEVYDITTSSVSDLFLSGSIIKDNGEVEIDCIVRPMIVEGYTVVKKEKGGNNFIVKVTFYNSNFEKENITMYVDRDNIKHLAYKMKNDRDRYEKQKTIVSKDEQTLKERKSIVEHSIANM